MSAKRMTLHSGRYSASAKHNDRAFDLSKADNIDVKRMGENYYWECASGKSCKGAPDVSFDEAEIKYYERYQGVVDEMNQKALEQRHKDRLKTIEKYHSSKKTMPEEEIFYIGKQGNTADGKDIWNIFVEYMKWHQQTYPNVKYLDIALHMDEATPHIHARKVWEYTDENGNLAVCQKEALSEMGVKRPDPTKPETRNNNAKMTYTASCRAKMMEICKNRGYDLIEEPEKRSASEKNLNKAEYINRKLGEEIEQKETELEILESRVLNAQKQEERIIHQIEQKQTITERLNDTLSNLFTRFNNAYLRMQKILEHWLGNDGRIYVEICKKMEEPVQKGSKAMEKIMESNKKLLSNSEVSHQDIETVNEAHKDLEEATEDLETINDEYELE